MRWSQIISKYKFLIGPLLFFCIIFSDLPIENQPKNFLAIFSLVIAFWLFTSIPLFISGLLGVSLSVLFGIATPTEAFAPFADPIIFLFLGGFLLGKALESTELDKRLAHKLLSHPKVQHSPKAIVFVFLGLSFFLSMWISNTATVAMLLPISYGVIDKLKGTFNIDDHKFNEQLLLALAYSATIGGNVTPIGSPPNIIAIGLLKNINSIHLSFFHWMAMALPISLILFFYVYRKCIKILPKVEVIEMPTLALKSIPFSFKQKNVVVIFSMTIFFWIFPSLLSIFSNEESSFFKFINENISAPVVAIIFASILYLLPLNSTEKILNSDHTSQIDWPSLLLFGSGLSLGKILFKTGLTKYLVMATESFSLSFGPVLLVIILIVATIYFTEIASNTASANIIIPVSIVYCNEMSLNATIVAFAFALACNSAFMLPVATPPNALVFGSKRVNKNAMIKAGFNINIISAILLCVFIFTFIKF